MKETIIKDYPVESLDIHAQMNPQIRLAPFSPFALEEVLKTRPEGPGGAPEPSFWLEGAEDLALFKSGGGALMEALRQAGVRRDQKVMIVTTTHGGYVDPGVIFAIEQFSGWTRKLEYNTGAILVIHEFGFPCELPYGLLDTGLPIIEECSYALGMRRLDGGFAGRIGDYAVYSLFRSYPVPFGGVLVSRKKLAPHEEADSLSNEGRSFLESVLVASERLSSQWDQRRIENWWFFADRLKGAAGPYFELKKGVVPGVFLLKLPESFSAEKLRDGCVSAGIESGEYNGRGFYLPSHQFLTGYEREYIVHRFLKAAEEARIKCCSHGHHHDHDHNHNHGSQHR